MVVQFFFFKDQPVPFSSSPLLLGFIHFQCSLSPQATAMVSVTFVLCRPLPSVLSMALGIQPMVE